MHEVLGGHRVPDLDDPLLLRREASCAGWLVLLPNARSRPATADVLAWLLAEAAACGPALQAVAAAK